MGGSTTYKVSNNQEMLLYYSLKNLHLLEQTDKMTVMRDLLGLQSQFMGYAQNSLRIRAYDYREEDWGEGLVKIWSHRGTMHLVSEETLAQHLAAAGAPSAFTDGAWDIPKTEADKWAAFIQDEVRRGNNTRNGLKDACAAAGMTAKLSERVFYGWGGLIYEMTIRGMLAGLPGNKKEYLIPELKQPLPNRREALEAMVQSYFVHFGPATTDDCKRFFGPGRTREMRSFLKDITGKMHVTVIDGRKYYSAEELTMDGEIPDCILVPGFDQLILGYKDRSRMVEKQHLNKLTNISGIICPSVIVRNKIRARWILEGDSVTITPFERLLKKDEAAIKRKVKATFGSKIKVCFTDSMQHARISEGGVKQ